MFKEYDVVKAKIELSAFVRAGTRGAVLICYDGAPKEYEVEFVDESGETLDVLTVAEHNLEFVFRPEEP